MNEVINAVAEGEDQLWAWVEGVAEPMERPTDGNRSLYLDLAERIVRSAVPWQRADGLIIDPTTGEEAVTTTPRFVGALGLLIGAGRCADLVDACSRSMDACCWAFANGIFDGKPLRAAEFYTKELVLGLRGLSVHMSADRCQAWRDVLSSVDPVQFYDSVRAGATHNFPIYAVAGEQLRQADGLGSSQQLIDDVLDVQRSNFTGSGMYRDPADPITYDLTVRQQIGLMLVKGYRGRHRQWMDEVTRKGGLVTLLMQSVTGQAPFGGRSNQFHIQEGMMACICEMEAVRWHRKGRPLLAGALKRAARNAALSTHPWIMDMTPFRQTKSGFPPDRRHGIDSGGEYSCYGLLAASLFATAWHVADEGIPAARPPARAGGLVLALWPEFHKVFATCGGYHIEIDTRADLAKDATGLGRLHRLHAPPHIALSAPICAEPAYTLCTPPAGRHLAIGPAWVDASGGTQSLAQMSQQISDVHVRVQDQGVDRVEFTVTYEGNLGGVRRIVEGYSLTAGGLEYTVDLSPTPEVSWLTVPLLVSDGLSQVSPAVTGDGFELRYAGYSYRVKAHSARASLVEQPAANRNGIYHEGRLEGCRQAHLSVEPPTG